VVVTGTNYIGKQYILCVLLNSAEDKLLFKKIPLSYNASMLYSNADCQIEESPVLVLLKGD